MNKGAKLIADAIAELDSRVVIVDNTRYVLFPPTIRTIALAGRHLMEFDNGGDIDSVLQSTTKIDNLARALSVFVKGDETLTEALSKGTLAEVVEGLQTAYSLISPQVFMTAVSLARNVTALIAKP